MRPPGGPVCPSEPARLLRRQRPRVRLNREAVGRPLFAYPFVEVDAGLELDPMVSGPDDYPRPVGVVFGHAKSVGAHERMFAYLVRVRHWPCAQRSRLRAMGAPEPMLSTAIRSWPQGGDWMLEPKFDGFRVLIEVASDRRVRAWSRHGTNLTEGVGGLLRAFEAVPAGTVIDGELIALTERNGRPAQNFAALCRAVLNRNSQASNLLHYVAVDLLARGGADLRREAWRDRRGHLGEVLPTSPRVRQIDCLPATVASHAAMIELGFEGSVLKRPASSYRVGRHRSWRKLKARRVAQGIVEAVRVAQDGQVYAICDVDGRRVAAVASPSASERIGEAVELVYSRVDAEGALREVRLAPTLASLPT
jgi:hypothetical protein